MLACLFVMLTWWWWEQGRPNVLELHSVQKVNPPCTHLRLNFQSSSMLFYFEEEPPPPSPT